MKQALLIRPWLIRPATREDVAAIVALERLLPTAPHWPEKAYVEASEARGRCLLVAEADGGLVGFAVGALLGDESELESVGVAPAAQGRGIGGALVSAVMEWASSHAARSVLLEVRAGSEGAQRVYRRAGFTEAGLRRGYYADPDDDAVLMRWEPEATA